MRLRHLRFSHVVNFSDHDAASHAARVPRTATVVVVVAAISDRLAVLPLVGTCVDKATGAVLLLLLCKLERVAAFIDLVERVVAFSV